MTKYIKSRYNTVRDARDTIVLRPDTWDDYGHKTLFEADYWDENGKLHSLGMVKVVKYGVDSGYTPVPDNFDMLDDDFATLGQSQTYYETMNSLPLGVRNKLLRDFRDVVFDKMRFERFSEQEAFITSAMRNLSIDQIERFRAVISQAYRALGYTIRYVPDPRCGELFQFKVSPDSVPNSNLHVLIGRNGIGKTTILADLAMAACLPYTEYSSRLLSDDPDHSELPLSAVISVSFSAFDRFKVPKEDGTEPLLRKYTYVGLRVFTDKQSERLPLDQAVSKDFRLKSDTEIDKIFVNSVANCVFGSQREDWLRSVTVLAADPRLRDLNIDQLASYTDRASLMNAASMLFSPLSSGHKIALLIVTTLAELLEDRTLVLVDEPEGHLHPPLLASLVQAIGELLASRNSLGILATHSPVVLQEVPSDCVWILDRPSTGMIARRPTIETYGENVGILTHEVFELELRQSGHFQILNQVINDRKLGTLDEVVAAFGGKIGAEGRAVALALLAARAGRHQ